jgi:pimeloyl-ACP methyl ester carboxylesterase
MKKKTVILAGAATLAGAAALTLAGRYQQWKRSELARMKKQSQIVTTSVGPIEYTVEGQGPAMLIIHGSPGGYDQGISFSRWLNIPNFTYIAPSRPGYLNTPLHSGVSPEAQADLYAALLDTLQIEQAVVLGLSGGGPSALQFALRHPERCRGLVLFCALVQRYVESEIYRELPLSQRLSKPLKDKLFLFDPFLYFFQSISGLQTNRLTETGILDSFSLGYLRKEGYHNDMSQFGAITPYPLEKITAPTFVAQGTADTELPFANAQLLAREIPQAVFVPVEGADHFFFLTHEEQFMPALRDFLQTL